MRNGISLHCAKSIQDDHRSCEKSIFYSFFRSTISSLLVPRPWLSCFPSAPTMLRASSSAPASPLLPSPWTLRPTPAGEQPGTAEASLGKVKPAIRLISNTTTLHFRIPKGDPAEGPHTRAGRQYYPGGGPGKTREGGAQGCWPLDGRQRGEPLGGGIHAATPSPPPPILTGTDHPGLCSTLTPPTSAAGP